MELKTLNYFITIVEEGNISKAAKKLYMSQPPLSLAMKNLEKELGVVLFERGTNAILLTDEGKILYEKAKDMLLYSKNIKEELKDKENLNKSKIRLGLVSSVTDQVIKDYIALFIKQEQIDFELYEGNTYALIEKIENGLIDLAIVRTPYKKSSLEIIPLKKERIALIKKIDNQGINKDTIKKEGLIVYRRWLAIVEEALEKEQLDYTFKCINDDARTTLSLVKQGLGIGVLPESIIETSFNSHELEKEYRIDYDFLNIESEIDAIYKPDKYHNHSFSLFVNQLKNNK